MFICATSRGMGAPCGRKLRSVIEAQPFSAQDYLLEKYGGI